MRRALVAVATTVGLAGCQARQARRAPAPATAPATADKPHAGSAATATAAAASAPAKGAGLIEGAAVRPHHEISVVECPARVPDGASDDARLSALLDAANQAIDDAAYSAAFTCADRAADLSPDSVEAEQLRGTALAALGRDGEAQLAYSLALSLDPEDPETLRAVADFYINGKGDRSRDALLLGLELAERGTRRTLARRHHDQSLAADLAVLEAQALDDLGRSDEAIDRADAALRIAPARGDALHEKGVALFDMLRFPEARAAFEKALAAQPDDPYTHQMYGLTLEQLGDQKDADAELAKATQLAPSDLPPPVMITVPDFQKEIDAVVATLAPARRLRVKAIKVQIEDLPELADLQAVSPPFPPTILGLYRGPVGRAPQAGDDPPSIVLYRKNLARAVKTRAELTEQIRDTLLHEIGHLEGLDEDDLRRRGME